MLKFVSYFLAKVQYFKKILQKSLASHDLNFSWNTLWLAKQNQCDFHSFYICGGKDKSLVGTYTLLAVLPAIC
jgi:hypothetical protein